MTVTTIAAVRRSVRLAALFSALVAMLVAMPAAFSQDLGTLNPKPLPPLKKPDDPRTPARQLFARRPLPAKMPPQAIGFYSHGCLAGGEELPLTGKTWQVMRPSRNRNWGHPALIKFIKDISKKTAKVGWRGLLIGDMAQPRGGPMLNGHASHQVGLDADIWLRPMPDRVLTRRQREVMMSTMVVAPSRKDVDPKLWTPAHVALIKAIAEDRRVQRVLANPAIKRALCRYKGRDRHWLSKVRPWWGHDYHIHVRLFCPLGNPQCKPQAPVPASDGCGKQLTYWLRRMAPPKPAPKPKHPSKKKPVRRHEITMKNLPAACRKVLLAP